MRATNTCCGRCTCRNEALGARLGEREQLPLFIWSGTRRTSDRWPLTVKLRGRLEAPVRRCGHRGTGGAEAHLRMRYTMRAPKIMMKIAAAVPAFMLVTSKSPRRLTTTVHGPLQRWLEDAQPSLLARAGELAQRNEGTAVPSRKASPTARKRTNGSVKRRVFGSSTPALHDPEDESSLRTC
jgi:hypothetical protein